MHIISREHDSSAFYQKVFIQKTQSHRWKLTDGGVTHWTGGIFARDLLAASAGVALLAAGVLADLTVQALLAVVVVQEAAVAAVAAAAWGRPVLAFAVAFAFLAGFCLIPAAREMGSEREKREAGVR